MYWYTILSAVAFIAVAWVVHHLRQRASPKLDLPVVGSPGDRDFSQAIIERYKKYPDQAFILPTDPPRVILPMPLFQETIHASEEDISFFKEVYENFHGGHTGIGTPRDEITHAIKGDLTKNIPNILPLFQDEARYGFDKELGNPQEWTAIPLYPKLLRLIALVSGRVFVGAPNSREEEWLDLTINFTLHVRRLTQASLKWNNIVRSLVAPFLPEMRGTLRDLKRGEKWMEPMVADVLARHDREKTAPARPGDKGAFVSWLLSYLPRDSKTAKRIGSDQLFVSFASIHTTSMTLTQVVIDLASRPEYIGPLRSEIEGVTAEHGTEPDGNRNPYLPKSSIARLKKLDSFIKESQRCNPLGFTVVSRWLLKDFTFSNGLKLPKDTRVAFPSWAVAQSETTEVNSPECNEAAGNPGPEEFDGFRFAKLRDIPGRESRHQAVTTGPDSLSFGHGPRACPGRFFAIYEIKILLIELLMNYDFRIKGDVEGKGGEEIRPKTVADQLTNCPDFTAKLEIKRRADKQKEIEKSSGAKSS